MKPATMKIRPRRGATAGLLAIIPWLATGVQSPAQPPSDPPVPPAASSPATFASADELLAALEHADEQIAALAADVRYDRTFEIQGDRQIRLGRLYFQAGDKLAEARRAPGRFAVRFERLRVGDVVRRDERVYAFDGQWLIERYPQERPPLMIRRRVVPPGQTTDPLRLGEGPFPLPIGQRAEDIRARFTVELLPAEAGLDPVPDADELERLDADDLKRFVRGCWQVRLVPHPAGTPAAVADHEFAEIRLWYRREDDGLLLPRMARTVDRAGDVSVVQLINVAVQRVSQVQASSPGSGVRQTTPAIAELFSLDPPGPEWIVETVEWQQSATRQGGEPPDAGDP